jgi:riboflavin kinase/FMN adenylyltransferase
VTSEQFVRDYLHNQLKAKVIVAGFNHHFGFNKEGDYRQLWAWREKYGFEAEEIPEQEVQHETVSSTKIRQAISEGYIQRANAYLDHYYIIMGQPEKYFTGASYDVPELFKVPLSEECKLLPLPGVYAVSVENAEVYSKGMVIINRKPEERDEVLINIFDFPGIYDDHRIAISFHKKIHGAVNFSDNKSGMKISSARDEISELIY